MRPLRSWLLFGALPAAVMLIAAGPHAAWAFVRDPVHLVLLGGGLVVVGYVAGKSRD